DLWIYSLGVENQKKEKLELLLKENNELLKDISNYHIGVIEQNPKDSKYYHDLAMVEKAYLLLKANKKNQAKVILEQIPQNSPLSNIAKFLKHYTITAK
ncbi:MAG: hypothetical protein GXO02_03630, partial [Epsilonproteobacteria bacterium]|nr:hypothetical protein [Campylobacterota bacterium]